MAQMLGPSGFLSNSSKKENGSSSTAGESSSTISARVKDIILDNSHPRFTEFGEWNSIGVIFFEIVANPEFATPITDANAYPLFPNIKHYPLKEEIVTLTRASDVNSEGSTTSISWYYFPPVNIWNSPIHNALPLIINPNSRTDDYQKADVGFVRQISDSSTNINLGGRFSNSIRLGSTVNNAKIPNPWSAAGENGSPIFILRNGQSSNQLNVEDNSNSWVPTLEDINNDKSSIYLTSTQQIPLLPASSREDSYRKSTPPEAVRTYSGEQIILNSGRLVFNAKNDSIILGAVKSIHLTSNTSVNVDGATQIALVAPKVYLGSTTGAEDIQLQSLVLGENLNVLLGEIASFLGTLNIAFQTATDATGAPIASLSAIACDAETLNKSILNIVNGKNLLSKQVKTI